VYPELVIGDQAGQIQGVHYEELAPMLLNEVQQQQLKLTAQAEKITVQEQQLHDMQLQLAEVKKLKQRLAALKVLNQSVPASGVKLHAKDGRGDRL